MVLLRYLLMMIGIGLLVGAAGILVWDLYTILKSRKSPAAESANPWKETASPQPRLRWQAARRLVALSAAPLLIGWSIAVVPSGAAGVRVNQFVSTRPETLDPAVHWIETLKTYNIRDSIFITTLDEDLKKPQPTSLLVQTREGFTVDLAIAVRYRLDPNERRTASSSKT